jgi:hypothetical protein
VMMQLQQREEQKDTVSDERSRRWCCVRGVGGVHRMRGVAGPREWGKSATVDGPQRVRE